MDWDEESELLRSGRIAGPSSIDGPRKAVLNDLDRHVPMPIAAPHLQPAEEETPLQQLIRHWTNERHAPDILPAQEDLLMSVLDHIHRQVHSRRCICSPN